MNSSHKPLKSSIIAFANNSWYESKWMNRQQLLSRLGARGWPVIYSNGAMDVWDRGKSQWQMAPLLGEMKLQDDVFVANAGRIQARWPRFQVFDEMAIRRHSYWTRSKVSRNEEIIVIIFHPKYFPYIKYLKPCKVVFHAYDTYALQQDWDDQQDKFQSELVKCASLITASSPAIARNLQGNADIHILPNGADVKLFQTSDNNPEPGELMGIPTPRICYIGTVNRKVDLPLVSEIAQAQPNWEWIFVGEVKEREILADVVLASAYKICQKLSNIHFLGEKHRQKIPDYMTYMDVHVLCYRSDEIGWWDSCYPLKLHEYLAMGMPVVSADLEVVRPFQSVIAIAQTVDDWINALRYAIDKGGIGNVEERKSIAEKNSWDSRVDILEKLLHEI